MASKSSRTAFSGKTALITGGSRGIGLATARLLAEAGCRVAITARDKKQLRAAAAEIGGECLALSCDVSSEPAVKALAAKLRKEFGHLDFLFNNAGRAHALQNVESLAIAEWRHVLDTNLTGTFLVCHHLMPLLRRGGVIVNNVSVAATRPFAGFSAYCASKAGVLAFTATLREELREKGIRVTALVPGATGTDIWQQFWPDAPREKMVAPETVARAVLHVLSLPPNSSIDELQIGPASGVL